MNGDDDTLMQHIRSGNTQRFGSLAERHGHQLMLFVGRIVSQREDAEDVVQNAFVAAYEHLNDYDPERASVQTWLQRIAYHEALRHLRRSKRQMVPLEVTGDVPDELPETTTAEQLDEAIRQLQPEDQMLLQLYYFDRRALKDIAYIMGATTDTLTREVSRLGSRMHRIRQRLRVILTRMNNE